jgi:hypothetical protein
MARKTRSKNAAKKGTRKAPGNRKGPSSSATEHPEGTIEWGSDGQRWVVTKTAKGVQRWVPIHSAALFGWQPLTVGVLAENIGKSIAVYERQIGSTWPKSSSNFDVKYKFTPTGDGELIKKGKHTLYPNWLKKRTFILGKHDIFSVLGKKPTNPNDFESVQVGPKPSELASTNLMNSEAFITF